MAETRTPYGSFEAPTLIQLKDLQREVYALAGPLTQRQVEAIAAAFLTAEASLLALFTRSTSGACNALASKPDRSPGRW